MTWRGFEVEALGSRSDNAKNRLLPGRVHDFHPSLKEYIKTHPRQEPTDGKRYNGIMRKAQRRPRLGSVARRESLTVDTGRNKVDIPRAHAVTLDQNAPEGA